MARLFDYDAFAEAYQRHWLRDVPPQIMTVIDRLLVPRLPAGSRILDLCCGTGFTLAELARRGFRVTGLDVSAKMLRYARACAPEAQLIRADARSFHLPTAFDAAISTFDSLNHILELAELTEVFRNVHGALVAGGLFFFDMNMERAFIEHWAEHFSIVESDEACVLRGAYDRRSRFARYDITIFRRQAKGWKRSDSRITERCYTLREIKRALREAGFTAQAEVHEAETQPSLRDHTGRTFFLTRKIS